MCEFCEEEIYLLNYKDCTLEIQDNELYIRTYKNNVAQRIFSTEINYCPMCGRKLGED